MTKFSCASLIQTTTVKAAPIQIVGTIDGVGVGVGGLITTQGSGFMGASAVVVVVVAGTGDKRAAV